MQQKLQHINLHGMLIGLTEKVKNGNLLIGWGKETTNWLNSTTTK